MDLSRAEDCDHHIGFANRMGFGAKPALKALRPDSEETQPFDIDSRYGDVVDISAVTGALGR